MVQRCRLIVTGHVQGVCFRWYTQRTAARLGLRGWVRNLPDGGVEIVAEGDLADLHQLVAWAQHGPSEAEVDEVRSEWSPATGEFAGFEIR
jgi:acylphosphatase